MIEYKDILVPYKGGGYDGCFWEWNFFLFDSKGKFHDIFSSGYKGISKEEDARDLLEDDDAKDVYVCDLTDEDDVNDFQDETNEGLVIGVTTKVNEIYDEAKMWWICDCCEQKVAEGTPEGWRGAGGIAIEASKKVCEECHSLHSCPHCGEFYDDISEADVEGFDKCIYCVTDDEMKSTCKNCHHLGIEGCTSESCVYGFDQWTVEKIAEDLGYGWYDWVLSVCTTPL